MGVFCTFKINVDNQNSEPCCIKDQRLYANQVKESQPLSATSIDTKSLNQDLMDILCTFLINVEIQKFEQGCIKNNDHMQIKIEIQNFSQGPLKFKLGLKGYGYSLYLSHQCKQPKFANYGTWEY